MTSGKKEPIVIGFKTARSLFKCTDLFSYRWSASIDACTILTLQSLECKVKVVMRLKTANTRCWPCKGPLAREAGHNVAQTLVTQDPRPQTTKYNPVTDSICPCFSFQLLLALPYRLRQARTGTIVLKTLELKHSNKKEIWFLQGRQGQCPFEYHPFTGSTRPP